MIPDCGCHSAALLPLVLPISKQPQYAEAENLPAFFDACLQGSADPIHHKATGCQPGS
jgi:hypothetical protein